MMFPSVARRSPAITTPSANRNATTVVPCATAGTVPRCASLCAGRGRFESLRRMRAAKLGPGSSPGGKRGRPTRLLPALLHVIADELLGVLLEDLVDLVEQVVELGLQLLALRGRRGGLGLLGRRLLARRRCRSALLLLLCHQPTPRRSTVPTAPPVRNLHPGAPRRIQLF